MAHAVHNSHHRAQDKCKSGSDQQAQNLTVCGMSREYPLNNASNTLGRQLTENVEYSKENMSRGNQFQKGD